MADMLERILAEIRHRKSEAQSAVDESRRLQAALEALGQTSGESAAPTEPAPGGRRARRPAPERPRAPRGANRKAILDWVADRPGATVAEISAGTGIARPTVYTTTGKLSSDGALERVDLGGGAVGFRVRRDGGGPDSGAGDDATTTDTVARAEERGEGQSASAEGADLESPRTSEPAAPDAGA